MIFHPGFFPSLEELNSNFSLHLPFHDNKLDAHSEVGFIPLNCVTGSHTLFLENVQSFQLHRSIFDEIRQSYFGNNSIDQRALLPYVSLFSDINFAYGIDRTAKIHATKSSGNTFYLR